MTDENPRVGEGQAGPSALAREIARDITPRRLLAEETSEIAWLGRVEESARRIAAALRASEAAVESLRKERDEARRFGEDAASRYNALLAEGRILRCAFCNAEYPPGTPASQHEALTAHVMVCATHPMRKVEAELAAARAEATKTERERCAKIAERPRIMDAMRGIVAVPDFGRDIAAAIRAPRQAEPNCHCSHLNCRGKCDCPVCVPNPPGFVPSSPPPPSEEPRPPSPTDWDIFDAAVGMPTLPRKEPMGTCLREKRPHAFNGAEDGDTDNGCIDWKPVPSPEPPSSPPPPSDGFISFEDFEKRKPEMIASIRRSERLTGGDMATRIGTVEAPPPSEELRRQLKEELMPETRREVRVTVQTRAINLETTVEVYGDNTPEEAVKLVREALAHAEMYTIDPAVEG